LLFELRKRRFIIPRFPKGIPLCDNGWIGVRQVRCVDTEIKVKLFPFWYFRRFRGQVVVILVVTHPENTFPQVVLGG
jgi:hypothetical protein